MRRRQARLVTSPFDCPGGPHGCGWPTDVRNMVAATTSIFFINLTVTIFRIKRDSQRDTKERWVQNGNATASY